MRHLQQREEPNATITRTRRNRIDKRLDQYSDLGVHCLHLHHCGSIHPAVDIECAQLCELYLEEASSDASNDAFLHLCISVCSGQYLVRNLPNKVQRRLDVCSHDSGTVLQSVTGH